MALRHDAHEQLEERVRQRELVLLDESEGEVAKSWARYGSLR